MPKKKKAKTAALKFKNIPKKHRVSKKSKEKVVFTRQKQFPNFYRFITEALKPLGVRGEWAKKGIYACFILVLLAIIAISLHLFVSLKTISNSADNSLGIAQEAVYWQNVEKTYPNYRDSYFQLALIAYQVGNLKRARLYLKQAEAIDPNYQGIAKLQKYLN